MTSDSRVGRDRAEVMRDVARKLLEEADELDGVDRCECGHTRGSHDPAGWNRGWCSGDTLADDPPVQDVRRKGHEIEAVAGECDCEYFTPW